MDSSTYGYSNEQILADILSVANGAESLSSSDYEAQGTISLTTVRYHFGTWNLAVKSAGLIPIESGSGKLRRRISDEDLLEELIRLKNELGRAPTEALLSANGKFSLAPYRDRWGTLKVAFEKAIEVSQ